MARVPPCPEPCKLNAEPLACKGGSNLHVPVGFRRVAYGWASECSAVTRFAFQRSAGASAVTVWVRPRRAARRNWAIHPSHARQCRPLRCALLHAARNWRRQESRRRVGHGRPQAAEGRRRLRCLQGSRRGPVPAVRALQCRRAGGPAPVSGRDRRATLTAPFACACAPAPRRERPYRRAARVSTRSEGVLE
jgi:hypothetical protein